MTDLRKMNNILMVMKRSCAKLNKQLNNDTEWDKVGITILKLSSGYKEINEEIESL